MLTETFFLCFICIGNPNSTPFVWKKRKKKEEEKPPENLTEIFPRPIQRFEDFCPDMRFATPRVVKNNLCESHIRWIKNQESSPSDE